MGCAGDDPITRASGRAMVLGRRTPEKNGASSRSILAPLRPGSKSNADLAEAIAAASASAAGPDLDELTEQMAAEEKARTPAMDIETLSIIRPIGMGGQGGVWLCVDTSTNFRCAVKQIRKGRLALLPKKAASRPLLEREALCDVGSHPFITSCYATFQNATSLFFALELAPGGDLFSLLDHHPSGLPEHHARFYAACVALALRHVHAHGYVYRDVKYAWTSRSAPPRPSAPLLLRSPPSIVCSTRRPLPLPRLMPTTLSTKVPPSAARPLVALPPGGRSLPTPGSQPTTLAHTPHPPQRPPPARVECSSTLHSPRPTTGRYAHAPRPRPRGRLENVLIGSDGFAKICDFGFAKKACSSRTFTKCGTDEYAPPEVVSGRGRTAAADWWALGILLHEMLTGRPPFEGSSAEDVFQAISEFSKVESPAPALTPHPPPPLARRPPTPPYL